MNTRRRSRFSFLHFIWLLALIYLMFTWFIMSLVVILLLMFAPFFLDRKKSCLELTSWRCASDIIVGLRRILYLWFVCRSTLTHFCFLLFFLPVLLLRFLALLLLLFIMWNRKLEKKEKSFKIFFSNATVFFSFLSSLLGLLFFFVIVQ